MTCFKKTGQGAEILIGYCAGTLDPALRARVDGHLSDCPACRQLAEAQQQLWRTLDQWTSPAVSENFDARLHARIAREDSAPLWKKWTRRIFQPAVPVAIW